MHRSFMDRILAGICGGLGQSTPVNAWFWRILFILLAVITSGTGALLYLMLWWILPQDSPVTGYSRSFFRALIVLALAILVIGGWIIRDRLVSETGIDLYFPGMLVLTALVFLLRQFRRSQHAHSNMIAGLVVLGIALFFLLSALQIFPEGIYDLLLRAAPAVLIFAGLSLLLRDRIPLGNVVALVVSVVLVGGVAAIAFSNRNQELRDDNMISIEQRIDDKVTTLQVIVNTLATDVEFLNTTDNDPIVSGLFVGGLESDLVIEYDHTEGNQTATLIISEEQSNAFPLLEQLGRGMLRVELPINLATAVTFSGINGDAAFNLGALDLERLEIDLQSGDAVITLPAYQPLSPSVASNPGKLNLYNGAVTLRVPDKVGGQFVVNYPGSEQPQFDDRLYSQLVTGDTFTLESRAFDTFAIQIGYIINVPSGSAIRLEVLE